MKRYLLVTAILVLFFSQILLAQEKPDSKLKFSFSERFRMVMYDNAIDLDDTGLANQNFTRMRTSVGLDYKPLNNLEFKVKLTHEFRYYFTPKLVDFHANEIMLDQLYVKLKLNKFVPGVLTVGRQNIMLGEGFVILDGHPGDGSRSAYFNAIRYDWNIKENHTLTGFFAYQPEEDFIPTINGKDIDAAFQGNNSFQLIEQSERVAALYYNGDIGKINLHTYGIWKEILFDGLQRTPHSNIYTGGARVKIPLVDKLNLTAEGAYQFGTIGDNNRGAYGGYLYLSYLPKIGKFCCPVSVNLGTFMLSGDNINTDTHEAWDPLFSRWPKWSESYIYTSLMENSGKIAYWSNMIAPYIQTKFNISKEIVLDLNYYQLFSAEQTATYSFLSGNGKNRGGLIVSKLSYKISDKVTGHILWEHFEPGDFYFEDADSYNWARMEILFKI